MSTYAIGDVQGCYDSLMALLDKISYKPTQDTLWFAGDLVNRGPKSLETLRFIQQQPDVQVVLGNHDLHLIATYLSNGTAKKKDTFQTIMEAKDADQLIDWLRRQKLLVYDKSLDFCMTHAGIPHIWSLKQARQCASELETMLSSKHAKKFAQSMYGNQPTKWDDKLVGIDRYRVITNYFTRMRFIDKQGNLELVTKTGPLDAPKGYKPWFNFKSPSAKKTRLVFGHWAAIEGQTDNDRIFAIDNGCSWGNQLTALRLEDQKLFSVAAAD